MHCNLLRHFPLVVQIPSCFSLTSPWLLGLIFFWYWRYTILQKVWVTHLVWNKKIRFLKHAQGGKTKSTKVPSLFWSMTEHHWVCVSMYICTHTCICKSIIYIAIHCSYDFIYLRLKRNCDSNFSMEHFSPGNTFHSQELEWSGIIFPATMLVFL